MAAKQGIQDYSMNEQAQSSQKLFDTHPTWQCPSYTPSLTSTLIFQNQLCSYRPSPRRIGQVEDENQREAAQQVQI